QEDADAIALSSYQGGHVEYFKYMVDMLREKGASHIRVFGGGGGTITPEEIRELEAYGVERIYHPNDGMKMGLVEMIEDVVARTSAAREQTQIRGQSAISSDSSAAASQASGKLHSAPRFASGLDEFSIARMLSRIEDGQFSEAELALMRRGWAVAPGESRIPN